MVATHPLRRIPGSRCDDFTLEGIDTSAHSSAPEGASLEGGPQGLVAVRSATVAEKRWLLGYPTITRDVGLPKVGFGGKGFSSMCR
jgi:hypothetical protein